MVDTMYNFLQNHHVDVDDIDTLISILQTNYPRLSNESYLLAAAKHAKIKLNQYVFTSSWSYYARNREEAIDFFTDNSYDFAADAEITEI